MKRFEKGGALLPAFLMSTTIATADFVTTANPVHPSGTRASCDLPADQHIRNVGGSDGAGLCVGTSQEVTGRWQSIPELKGFQPWLQKRPGGSYPEMLASDLKTFTAAKGMSLPLHIQHTGGDIEFLRLAMKTRRMVGITYGGHDPFYGEQGIAHMVDCAHLDTKLGAIIDNNEPGRWRWMTDVQLTNRWVGRKDNGQPITVMTRRGPMEVGGGWMVVWMASPPPPIDTSARQYLPERSTVVHEEDGPATPIPEDGVDFKRLARPFLFGVDADQLDNPLLLNGVNSDKLKPKMRYWINGEEVDRADALRKLLVTDIGAGADPKMADDSALPYLSVVSDDASTEKLLVDAVKPYTGKLHARVYRSESWVAKTRLTSPVTAQLVTGKTVFRSETITADELTKAAKAALGIVDPSPAPPIPPAPVLPDPVKPDPAPPVSPPAPAGPNGSKIPVWLLAVGGYLLWRLNQRKQVSA